MIHFCGIPTNSDEKCELINLQPKRIEDRIWSWKAFFKTQYLGYDSPCSPTISIDGTKYWFRCFRVFNNLWVHNIYLRSHRYDTLWLWIRRGLKDDQLINNGLPKCNFRFSFVCVCVKLWMLSVDLLLHMKERVQITRNMMLFLSQVSFFYHAGKWVCGHY